MLRTLAKVWGGVLGVVWILFVACGDIADFDRFLSLQRGEKCGVHPLSLLAEDASFSPLGTSCISPPSSSSPATTLFVADTLNNRVVIFNIETITNGENAVNVLGQSNFTTNGRNVTQSGLGGTGRLQSTRVGQYLYVPDGDDTAGFENISRVMIFDVATISDGENAAYVLGQSNFTSEAIATTQSGVDRPYGVDLDTSNNRLFFAEQGNHRVLIVDVSSLSNGKSFDNVLGQSNFTSNSTATTQSGFNVPADCAYDSSNQRLFVSEVSNHRVLVFDVSTITNGENAVNVLGQANFTSGSANRGGSAGQNTLNSPYGLAYASPYLYVADNLNNRVLVFDVSSVTDGENAAYVLGQPNFTTVTSGTTIAKMNAPHDAVVDSVSNKLFVADAVNNRVLVFDVSTITNGEDAVNVFGQANFTSSDAALTQSGMNYPIGVALK